MHLVCPACRAIYSEQMEYCGLDGNRLAKQEADPLLGHTLGEYLIESRLGRGGMGCVYRAQHVQLGTPYAVKVLYGEKAANRETRSRFQREARASSLIRHPSVVMTHYFGASDLGLSYLVMELVEGPTLSEVIRAHAPLPVPRALNVAKQIASGLAEAHRLGFVHRDLKPGNVMLIPTFPKEQVKVLDFGVVSVVGSSVTYSQLTKTGYTLGTPAYMAPEQTQNPDVGAAADLYALGVIMYEMLQGERPFTGPIAQMMAKKVALVAPQLPPCGGLERVVAKLLERKPEHRLQPAEAVVEALGRLEEPGAMMQSLQSPLNLPTLEESQSKENAAATRLLPAQSSSEPTGTARSVEPPLAAPKPQKRALRVALGALMVAGIAFWASGSLSPGGRESAKTQDAGAAVAASPPDSALTRLAPVPLKPPDAGVQRAEPTKPVVRAVKPRKPPPRTPRRRRRPAPVDASIALKPEPKAVPKAKLDAGVAIVRSASRTPGKIKIKASVWFDVYVDGQRRFRHPKVAQPISVGSHRIELRNEEFGCKPIQRTIEIKSAQTTTVQARCQTR